MFLELQFKGLSEGEADAVPESLRQGDIVKSFTVKSNVPFTHKFDELGLHFITVTVTTSDGYSLFLTLLVRLGVAVQKSIDEFMGSECYS